MRHFIILSAICFLNINLNAQSSIVYKKNPVTGNLEVYQSQGGLPTGSPIYKIKKNVYGYLEVENIDASTDPFTKKPDYSNYNNFKPYQLPAKEIFETLETLNKRNAFDYVNSQTQTNNQQYEKGYKELLDFIENKSVLAKSFLNFYNSNISFPNRINDGWYEVVNISKLGTMDKYDYNYGICYVVNNKVLEYYQNTNIFNLKTGFVYQKIKIEVISNITSLKCSYRASESEYYYTLYFLDNILEYTKHIENPNFGYYTIYTPPDFVLPINNGVTFDIARNKVITKEEIENFAAGPYSTVLTKQNLQSNPCQNSLMTLAFKKTTDKFSIGIYNLYNKKVWILNDLSIPAGTCNSTILSNY